MGVLIETLAGNADHFQHFLGFFDRFCFRTMLMVLDDLSDLLPDPHDRVQGGHRILEDHADFIAADLLHVLFFFFQQILSFEKDLAVGYTGGRLRQNAQDSAGDGSLAGAGLTNQADGLALFQLEGHVIDSVDNFAFGGVFHGQIFHRQKHVFVCHGNSSFLSSSASGPSHHAVRHPAYSDTALRS